MAALEGRKPLEFHWASSGCLYLQKQRGSCFIVNRVYYFPRRLDVFLKVVTLWRVNLICTRYSVWVCLISQIMFISCGLGLPTSLVPVSPAPPPCLPGPVT